MPIKTASDWLLGNYFMIENTSPRFGNELRNCAQSLGGFSIANGMPRNAEGDNRMGQDENDPALRPENTSLRESVAFAARSGFGSLRRCAVYYLHAANPAVVEFSSYGLASVWTLMHFGVCARFHLKEICHRLRGRRQSRDGAGAKTASSGDLGLSKSEGR